MAMKNFQNCPLLLIFLKWVDYRMNHFYTMSRVIRHHLWALKKDIFATQVRKIFQATTSTPPQTRSTDQHAG